MKSMVWLLLVFFYAPSTWAETKPRARDLGIPFEGTPGALNAITDVVGVEVGHTTLIEGEGALVVGKGPVRTGVTVILPRGKGSKDPVFAGWFSLNGNGEMTETTWVEESGFLEGPIGITNTHSVGIVRDAIIQWQAKEGFLFQAFSLPVVAETYDGWLNDINGFHVKAEHVFEALSVAASGPVAEGNVGGGTGMITFGFKGGIGTSSRRLSAEQGGYTVGVLVQSNFGGGRLLRIAGVPVGRELGCDGWPCPNPEQKPRPREGSIIIVVATDAPLLAHQMKRLARRASLGLGRTGSISGNGSGDIFVAFSTANPGAAGAEDMAQLKMFPNGRLGPIFAATVEATEEAIINAMMAAETIVGRDDHKVVALPHDDVRAVMRKYGRLVESASQD